MDNVDDPCSEVGLGSFACSCKWVKNGRRVLQLQSFNFGCSRIYFTLSFRRENRTGSVRSSMVARCLEKKRQRRLCPFFSPMRIAPSRARVPLRMMLVMTRHGDAAVVLSEHNLHFQRDSRDVIQDRKGRMSGVLGAKRVPAGGSGGSRAEVVGGKAGCGR